ncbi:hypothetical protein LCGC14_1500870 [marine sediment metagenome]|uniref:Uncharacterized protein n=1 Tax=marine sediment metagenome TaxID=412755 RepID=A0A0F9JPZ5_9ZZZZ
MSKQRKFMVYYLLDGEEKEWRGDASSSSAAIEQARKDAEPVKEFHLEYIQLLDHKEAD